MYVTPLPYASVRSDTIRQTSARAARLVFIASARTNSIATEMLLSSSTFHSQTATRWTYTPNMRHLSAAKKAEKARAKELAYINEHLCAFDKTGKKTDFGADDLVYLCLELGKNLGGIYAKIAEENGVECYEWRDYDGYSKSCGYTMVRRSFTLNLKKGYYIYDVGGLITFVRGEIKRQGVACEWIEQGKAISDIKTVKGFLVRGEHIVAKSLKEAQRISAEKRSKQALCLLNARSKKQLVYQKLGNHMFTFEESLASGNCRPGTQNFKNRYEAAIGHEATEISLADLRKYGKKFGLEEYTERVIRYVMNKL